MPTNTAWELILRWCQCFLECLLLKKAYPMCGGARRALNPQIWHKVILPLCLSAEVSVGSGGFYVIIFTWMLIESVKTICIKHDSRCWNRMALFICLCSVYVCNEVDVYKPQTSVSSNGLSKENIQNCRIWRGLQGENAYSCFDDTKMQVSLKHHLALDLVT